MADGVWSLNQLLDARWDKKGLICSLHFQCYGPWLAPGCPSSLEGRLPSQGNPSGQEVARIPAWKKLTLYTLMSSPDLPTSSLFWVHRPDKRHKRQTGSESGSVQMNESAYVSRRSVTLLYSALRREVDKHHTYFSPGFPKSRPSASSTSRKIFKKKQQKKRQDENLNHTNI